MLELSGYGTDAANDLSLLLLLHLVPAILMTPDQQVMGQEKLVWRLAFFSRLEERKGI